MILTVGIRFSDCTLVIRVMRLFQAPVELIKQAHAQLPVMQPGSIREVDLRETHTRTGTRAALYKLFTRNWNIVGAQFIFGKQEVHSSLLETLFCYGPKVKFPNVTSELTLF